MQRHLIEDIQSSWDMLDGLFDIREHYPHDLLIEGVMEIKNRIIMWQIVSQRVFTDRVYIAARLQIIFEDADVVKRNFSQIFRDFNSDNLFEWVARRKQQCSPFARAYIYEDEVFMCDCQLLNHRVEY